MGILYGEIRKLLKKGGCKGSILVTRVIGEASESSTQERSLSPKELDDIHHFGSPLKTLAFSFRWGRHCSLNVIFLLGNPPGSLLVAVISRDLPLAHKVHDLTKATLCLIPAEANMNLESSETRLGWKAKTAKEEQIEMPQSSKITVNWMIHNVPMTFWLWAIGIIAAAFALGFKSASWVGHSPLPK